MRASFFARLIEKARILSHTDLKVGFVDQTTFGEPIMLPHTTRASRQPLSNQ